MALSNELIRRKEWMKLANAVDGALRTCMLGVLHKENPYESDSYKGLPRDKKELYIELYNRKRIIDPLRNKKIINNFQYELILPNNKTETDSNKFDCPLILKLIRNFTKLKTKNGRWNVNKLESGDNSLACALVKAVAFRHELFHIGGFETIDSERYWNDLKTILKSLKYVGSFEELRNVILDPDRVCALEREIDESVNGIIVRDDDMNIIKENDQNDLLPSILSSMTDQKKIRWRELVDVLKRKNRLELIELSHSCERHLDDAKWFTVRSHGCLEISAVSQLVLAEDNHIATILNGSRKITKLTLCEWDARCEEYYNLYFKRRTSFPPMYERILESYSQTGSASLSTVTESLLNNIKFKDGGNLFTGYDLIKHVKFCLRNDETKYEGVLDNLLIDGGNRLTQNDKRLLLTHSKFNIVINIRLSSSNEISIVKEEEFLGRNDLKILLYMNKRFLVDTATTFYNVILTPDKITVDYCKECLIFTSDMFVEWLNSTIMCETAASEENTCILKIVRSTVGFMAAKQFDMTNDERCFPQFRRNNKEHGFMHSNIIYVMFTDEQEIALSHPAKKKIIFGGYGAGKTLIGECLFKQLAKQEFEVQTSCVSDNHVQSDNNHILHLCYDERSMLHLRMKKLATKIRGKYPNVHVHAYNQTELAIFLKLKKVSPLSSLLEKLKEKLGCATLHVIIDELEIECLENTESKKLKQMFKRNDWEPATVLFLPQPLVKTRTLKSNNNDDLLINNNEAYKMIGMKISVLKDHMRSTVSNFTFSKYAEYVVSEEVKNQIKYPDHLELQTHNNENNTSNPSHGEAAITEDSQEESSSFQVPDTEEFVGSNTMSDATKVTSFHMPINIDEEFVTRESCNGVKHIETSFKCQQSENPGHQINSDRPKFIYFDHEPLNDIDCILKLVISLEQLCLKKRECSRLFLCKKREGYLLATNILNSLNLSYINNHQLSGKDNEIVGDLPEHEINNIVTDNRGARGIEAETVIVFVEDDTDVEQQIFLEMISRSTTNLFIIFPHHFKIDSPGNMPQIIHKIIKESIMREFITEFCITTLDHSEVGNPFPIIRNGNRECIGIDKLNTKWEYKNRLNKIKTICQMQLDSDQGITRSSPLESPTDLRCRIDQSDKTCLTWTLMWKDCSFDFIVKRKLTSSIEWEEISPLVSHPYYQFQNLIPGKDYDITVVKVSILGESSPAKIIWKHIDLFQLICTKEIDNCIEIIKKNPWRINDISDGWTLCHAAVECNCPGMIPFLLKRDITLLNRVHEKEKVSPSHVASYYGYTECLYALGLFNPNYLLIDKWGDDVYGVAGMKSNKKIKEEIQTYIKEQLKRV